MPKYLIVEEACRHCWNKDFMLSFQDFFDQYAIVFTDCPTVPAEEQNLEYYELFQKYLKLYEDILSDYIQSLDCSNEEFYDQLSAVLNDPDVKDKKLIKFVQYLIACTDYPSFYKVMVRAAKKLKKAEAKADNKLIGSVDTPSKGTEESDSDAKSSFTRPAESKDFK